MPDWQYILLVASYPLLGLLVGLVGYGVGRRIRRVADFDRKAYQRLGERLGRLETEKTEAEELVERLGERLRKLEAENAHAERIAEEERARADRFLESVQTIEKERDRWFLAYDGATRGHMNAQNLLMGQISNYLRRFQRIEALSTDESDEPAYKRLDEVRRLANAKPDPRLQALVDEYAEADRTVRDELGRPISWKGRPEPAEELASATEAETPSLGND